MARQPGNYVITGASSGLGAALACGLTGRGDRVALIARRGERLEQVSAQALEAAQTRGVPSPFEPLRLPADVLDREGISAALDQAEQQLPGGLDVLLLNAGIGGEQWGDRFDGERAAKIIDVNLTANVRMIAQVLPWMLERKRGHIVGVSSMASYRGLPGAAPYSASKAGFSVLLESLRLDLRPHGIAVTTITPGFVKSELTAKNKFKMPFLLETDDAVRRMVRGIDRRRREVRFPLPLALGVRFLRALPDPLYDFVSRFLGRQRGTA